MFKEKGKELEVRICPKCQNVMILRTNHKTGDKFWGCSSFPECRHTEMTEEEFLKRGNERAYYDWYDDGDFEKDMELSNIYGINGWGDD